VCVCVRARARACVRACVRACGRDQSRAVVHFFSVTDTELEFYGINLWPRDGYGNFPGVATCAGPGFVS
jgi:hypothetical protein